jgi:hypothetical protein
MSTNHANLRGKCGIGAKALFSLVCAVITTQALAGPKPEVYLEKCLAGLVVSSVCSQTITDFWNHNPAITQAAVKNGLDPALMRAVVATESRFKQRALSPKGAVGLMQVMPDTGKQLGVFNRVDLHSPGVNLDAGARYLVQMWQQFRNWDLAIAAYNAGPGAVTKYGNKIPPYAETQEYVVRVLAMYRLFKLSERNMPQLTANVPQEFLNMSSAEAQRRYEAGEQPTVQRKDGFSYFVARGEE